MSVAGSWPGQIDLFAERAWAPALISQVLQLPFLILVIPKGYPSHPRTELDEGIERDSRYYP
jgi:hypothetical protein